MEVECFMLASCLPMQLSCLPVPHVRVESSPMFWIADVPVVLFVVVNGIPSVGIQVMCGSGKIEKQKMLPVQSLPPPNIAQQQQKKSSGANFVVLSARSVLLGVMKYAGVAASTILLFAS